MRRIGWLGLATAALVSSPALGVTVDELIAKNIEARGGIDKINAISSVKATGKMSFGQGDFKLDLGFAQMIKGGVGCRTEVSLQGLTAINANDTKEAWQISPFQGRRDPERASADEFKANEYCSDIAGPLVDHQAKGHKVEYQGTEDFDGTEAHKLKVSLKNGNVQYYLLDPDYFLEILVRSKVTQRGVEFESETEFGNYEQVAGVWWPFSIESGPKGQPRGQKITIEKAEVNVAIDDSLFAFPGQ